ncbi:MAG: PLP-dependent aminotransferase family protein [Mesorhizobium sp.]
MTIWQPDPKLIHRPAYISLADQIARAIHDGHLPHGTRLPPHRKLAYDIGLSVQTVSRAYEELIRRDLVSGEIGRGTFVQTMRREVEPPYLPERLGELIDLSILKPICETMHLDELKGALNWLATNLPASSGLSFRPNVVFPRHRAVAAEWLKHCGLSVPAQNISVTNGATAAMTVALMSVAPPGSTVATEAIGHHTLMPLSTYLGFHLHGLPLDSDGIIPQALDEACQGSDIRAIFVQPSAINPTATFMGERRRAELVEVARKHDLAVIEGDVLGPLVDAGLPPIAALAPERTLYYTSFTKNTVPGLRIGYLVAPDRYVAAVANRHLVSNWMATPMVAEIATKWVTDGTAMRLVDWQRQALTRRQDIVREVMGSTGYMTHERALHIWIPLPENRSEEGFVAQARLQGVAIAPGMSFRTSEAPWHPAVRVSLGSTTENELRSGLGVISRLLISEAEHLLLAI